MEVCSRAVVIVMRSKAKRWAPLVVLHRCVGHANRLPMAMRHLVLDSRVDVDIDSL